MLGSRRGERAVRKPNSLRQSAQGAFTEMNAVSGEYITSDLVYGVDLPRSNDERFVGNEV